MELKLDKITYMMDECEPLLSLVGDVSITCSGLLNPVAGAALSVGRSFFQEYSTYKLKMFLVGLSKGNNVETTINQIYSYVNSGQNKAYQMGNVMKKVILAESKRSCVIMGIMVAKYLNNNTDFTIGDLIVCRALENANDFDLVNFKHLMSECVKSQRDGRRKIIYDSKDENRIIDYDMTCAWGVSGRLFIEDVQEPSGISFELNEEGATRYYVEYPADILLRALDEAKQIDNYS